VRRETRFGPVIGADESRRNGALSWKGIPFAAPPVGDLRWQAPVDPARWHRPRDARNFGNACVQYGRIHGPGANNRHDETIGTTLNQAVGSEDCLYLNIWRPARPRRGDLPVSSTATRPVRPAPPRGRRRRRPSRSPAPCARGHRRNCCRRC